MKTIAIIPSRYESSRFRGKPLKNIINKPMIQWVYERSSRSKLIDAVYVATDDDRIRNAVINFNGNVIMTSSFHNSGTDRVAEAAESLNIKDNDLIINIQGDQPLIDNRCLSDLIEPFYNEEKIKMTTLAFPIKNMREIDNLRDVKVVFNHRKHAIYFSRSTIPCYRDSDPCQEFYKHLGVYAYTKQFLKIFAELPMGKLETIEKLEQLRPLEYNYPVFVALTKYDSPEVDIPEDIRRIERKIRECHSNSN